MIREAALASMVAWFSLAPYQCGSSNSNNPEYRREDTAGDALWGLAERFGQEKNDEGRKATLKYLVERYPSNRHAVEARAELGLPEPKDLGHGPDAPLSAGIDAGK